MLDKAKGHLRAVLSSTKENGKAVCVKDKVCLQLTQAFAAMPMERNMKASGEVICGKAEVGVWVFVGSGLCPSNDRYEGEWKEDAKCGEGKRNNTIGVYYYANGNKYEGVWEKDVEWGRGKEVRTLGTLTCSSGEKYRGEWKEADSRRKTLAKHRNLLLWRRRGVVRRVGACER